MRHLVTARARLGNAVTSSTLLADPPSNETIDVFYIKKLHLVGIYMTSSKKSAYTPLVVTR